MGAGAFGAGLALASFLSLELLLSDGFCFAFGADLFFSSLSEVLPFLSVARC